MIRYHRCVKPLASMVEGTVGSFRELPERIFRDQV